MPQNPTAIRNVALVGHHGAGKTTLAEALLAATGAIARRGSVEKGTTTCDFEPEEISRQLSISTALAPFTVNGVKVNLLDTPGYADFASEMLAALARSRPGRRGGQRHRRRAGPDRGRLAGGGQAGPAPRDRHQQARPRSGRLRPHPGRDPRRLRGRRGADRAAHRGRRRLSRGDRPPGGHGHPLHTPAPNTPVDGTVPPVGREGPIPDDLVDEEHAVHEQLVEGIVVGDDGLMERYLGGEEIDYGELEKSLAGGVASGTVFPVLCCSGLTGVGVDRLARLDRGALPRAELRAADHRTGGVDDHRDPLRRRRATCCSR